MYSFCLLLDVCFYHVVRPTGFVMSVFPLQVLLVSVDRGFTGQSENVLNIRNRFDIQNVKQGKRGEQSRRKIVGFTFAFILDISAEYVV